MTDYPLTRPGLAVADSVLEAIVRRAAEEVDGVVVADRRVRRGLDVEVEVRGEAVRASLSVAIRYGVVLPEAAEEARVRVGRALAHMTGLRPEAVDVTVASVAS